MIETGAEHPAVSRKQHSVSTAPTLRSGGYQPGPWDPNAAPRRPVSDPDLAGCERAELVGLLLDSRDDARVLVTEVGEDQLRAEVQVAAAVAIDDVATGSRQRRSGRRAALAPSTDERPARRDPWRPPSGPSAPGLDDRERGAPSARFGQLVLGLPA